MATIDQHSGKKYLRQIRPTLPKCQARVLIDVYAVLDAFDVRSHPVGHAIKKLLCLSNGVRTDKADQKKDLQEAIDALYRAQEDLEEVQAFQLPMSNVRIDNSMAEILKGPKEGPAHTTTEQPDWQKNPWDKAKITPPEV